MHDFGGGADIPIAACPAAAEEDARTAVDLPPEVKTEFLEHMRTQETCAQ